MLFNQQEIGLSVMHVNSTIIQSIDYRNARISLTAILQIALKSAAI